MMEKEVSMRLLMLYMLYLKNLAKVFHYCWYTVSKKISLILRNTDSSGLHTSHLKFECKFSKEPVFEAEQVHLISNNAICPALPQHRNFVWEWGLNSKNFLDLFDLVHFPETVNKNGGYDRIFFSGLNMCPVGTGLETTQISSNQLLVPRVGFGIVIWRSLLSLVTSAYMSQCSLGVPLFLVSWNSWNEKALFKVWMLHST